ncbi:YhcN/YlaJ family sporulation lipoprotein [Bacillus sp. BRMEA1]|uniref:YhcN/YlaJ family sporulation lipoprotein n=1 Tax=Neobacillus endophyticus TaxID=2738405 RepID=UPI001563DF80|nr:YhcN/YlaJ family sporulation lipoprotein [Neobacillus endophyticus]NRD78454.1 YhcN/YlaJ family sporulation lipoprotein [Neobacillus endophyticus]
MQIIRFFLIYSCILLLASCNQNESAKNSQMALIKTTNPSPVVTNKGVKRNHVEAIKKDVSSYPHIYDVAVVKGKKDTLVAYKVKHLHRFRMKKIEVDVTKMLEKKYPKEDFTVSSDYKIFLEAVRLDEKIKNTKMTPKKAEKSLEGLVKMTKDIK